MPRARGHDGRATALLECLENARMSLGRMELDLQLVGLRARQANEREPRLKELLEPAEETARELQTRLDRYKQEVDRAIRLLSQPEL